MQTIHIMLATCTIQTIWRNSIDLFYNKGFLLIKSVFTQLGPFCILRFLQFLEFELFVSIQVNFGESFTAWIHVKALRVFVESVLRWSHHCADLYHKFNVQKIVNPSRVHQLQCENAISPLGLDFQSTSRGWWCSPRKSRYFCDFS